MKGNYIVFSETEMFIFFDFILAMLKGAGGEGFG